MTIKMRDTACKVVSCISDMTAQWLMCYGPTRGSGQADGVRGVAKSFHWRFERKVEEIQSNLTNVREEVNRDRAGGK